MRVRSLVVPVLLVLAGADLSAQDRPVEALPPDPQVQLRDAERELATTVDEIARLEDEARRAEVEAQGTGPRRDALVGRARREVRALHQLSQADPLVVRGGPELLMEHLARAGRWRRTLRATVHEIQETERQARTLAGERTRLATLLEAARQRRVVLERQRQTLELATTGRTVTDAVVGPSVTVYGGTPGEGDATGFVGSRGRLVFPVAGRAEVRRATHEGAEGPGLEVLAPPGTPVRAAFPGRVAFADRYGAYGRIVILDHGDHYYTVSANLGRVDVRVGQEVAAGATLGTVGVEDGRAPMVYFEVRHGSVTVDPVPWLGM